eukprot:13156532-Ditylum_brightwellii.AAC.1
MPISPPRIKRRTEINPPTSHFSTLYPMASHDEEDDNDDDFSCENEEENSDDDSDGYDDAMNDETNIDFTTNSINREGKEVNRGSIAVSQQQGNQGGIINDLAKAARNKCTVKNTNVKSGVLLYRDDDDDDDDKVDDDGSDHADFQDEHSQKVNDKNNGEVMNTEQIDRVDTVARHCGNESDDINDKDTDHHTVFIGVDTDENNEDAMKGPSHVNNTLASNCNR